MSPYTEDTLVQQTTADYLAEELGWQSVIAYNIEDFGPDSLLGRESDREVVLTRILRSKIEALNPGLPAATYQDAVRQIVAVSASQTLLATNREKYEQIKDGVPVTFRNAAGERIRERLRLFDFEVPENNHFLCVRELWVRGDLYRRRADVVGFVNGLPLLFMELKNISKDIRAAYEQNFMDYRDTVPHLFHHNAVVLLANGVAAKLGSVSSRFELMCRAVFSKFKAGLTIEGIHVYRADVDTINIVYKSLQQDREQADITDIIRQLNSIVDEAIETQNRLGAAEELPPFDISRIDFDRLRTGFEHSPTKRTIVQNLKTAIEQRLQCLLQQNPSRIDFQKHYEEIVAEYNREKDRVTIEKTFEEVLQFVNKLSREETRAVREGLNEESLAMFDLLKKPNLSAREITRIKAVAVELLKTLKAEKLRFDHWTDKEATRDAVFMVIKDFLWSDATGLPVDRYTEDDVQTRAQEVYHHVFRAYPTLPSPFYEARAG